MSGSDYTTTPNHGFVLPAYDADEEEWGYHLTQNWSAVDALLATTGTTVAFLPLSGGMMTGGIALPNDPATALGAATKQYVDAHAFTDAASDGNVYGRLNGAWAQAVALTGGTMTGPLTLSGDPSAAQQAATKNYVDIHSGQVFVGPSAPTTPNPNSFWWCSNDGQLYLFYNDGNSTQFVPATSVPPGLTDAPVDGATYGRRAGAWANVSTAPQMQANVGRNLLHNGLFNVAQRGVGPWTAQGYTADRWIVGVSTDVASFHIYGLPDADRTAIGDEAAQSDFQNDFTGNAAAGAFNLITQFIENIYRLSGKTVTVSFWAKSPTNLKLGVSCDQRFGTGGSPSAIVTGSGVAVTLTAAWVRYSATFSLPSVSGKTVGTDGNHSTALNFWYSSGATQATRAGNIGVQSGTIQLWGVQLEIGATATPLEKLDPADDLRHCQRFYCSSFLFFGSYQSAGLNLAGSAYFPTTMRATPAITPGSTAGNANVGALGFVPSATGVQAYAPATATGSAIISMPFTASADL